MITRRRLLTSFASITAGIFAGRSVNASETASEDAELRFPGDPTEHNVVYQFNKSDSRYHDAILFSAAEMLRKYNDNITIVITAFGPGIHILAKKPLRDVSDEVKQKINSMADYGIHFHAYGNTMNSLGWKKEDMHDFVEIVQVGAAGLIDLQEKGFSYISW